MTWLLWRQNRRQAGITAAAMGALAITLWITGVRMADTYRAAKAACTNGPCGVPGLFDRYGTLINFVSLTIAIPLLFGIFWGAPLIAREVETGTHTLAWTQSVSKRRWLNSKLWVLIASTLVWSTALTALVTWWSGTMNSLRGNRFDPGRFDMQGVVPVAYSLFAVCLGVAAGAVLRRTLPALGVTIFGYAAVRILVDGLLRVHYRAPVVLTSRLDQPDPARSGAWIISQGVTLNGQSLDGVQASGQCAGAATRPAMDQCLSDLGYRLVTRYQPAGRFWTFQFIESGLFIGLAVLLLVVCVVAVRRRDA
jgi:hypothetical protein